MRSVEEQSPASGGRNSSLKQNKNSNTKFNLFHRAKDTHVWGSRL